MSAQEDGGKPAPALTRPYAAPGGRRRFRRVGLALLAASLCACLSVSLIGFVVLSVLEMVAGITGFSRALAGGTGFSGGMRTALELATVNFLIFFITVPAAALALGLSAGRFPGRGILGLTPYLRWGGIWGAILVGGTTGLIGGFSGLLSAMGALITGGLVGTAAGIFCGYLMHVIIQPERQAGEMDISVF